MNDINVEIDRKATIDRIEVRRLSLPLRTPFEARHTLITERDLVVVRVDSDLGVGWGECSALAEPTYTDEFTAGAFATLSEELAPRLVRRTLSLSDLTDKLSLFPGQPMAKASLEMAMIDLLLKLAQTPLSKWLGSTQGTVTAGTTIGLGPFEKTADTLTGLAELGYQRVKLKISSATDLDAAVRLSQDFPAIAIQVDANGGCKPSDIERLTEASEFLAAIEQPFAPGEAEAARQLVAQTSVPIIADESADSVASIEALLEQKACSAVSIKPPRLGGLLATKAAQERCSSFSTPMTAGGMLESGLGRHSLAAVAALGGFSLVGDLSPARRWLAEDPWPDIEMHTIDGVARVAVPTSAGVCASPDLQTLQSVTTQTTLVN